MDVLWNRVLDYYEHDPFTLSVWGTMLVAGAVYWTLGGLFLLTDLTGRPKWLQRYRVQDVRMEPVS